MKPPHLTSMDPERRLLLDEQMCFPLYAASRAMLQLYQPLLEELGLTYPQYLVLMMLWERDGQSVKELGERLYLDSGTLTPLVKRLERPGGLVRRRRPPRDGRVVEVWLTPAGRQLRERALEVPSALACKVGLPAAELIRLREEFVKLFYHLRSLDERAHVGEERDERQTREKER
jgi:DNA-binding MarR family transcriptional regulator